MKYTGLDQIVEEVIQKLGDVERVYLVGDLAKGINSSVVDLIFIGNLNKKYLINLIEKSEKIIFIDAHTTWCGPCKKMAATSFQDEEVAEAFNSKYINLKVDIENDPDGQEIARMYKVQAYPTLLFINSRGKLLKTLVGFQTADKLAAVASTME